MDKVDMLIQILKMTEDKNIRACILQSYIAEMGAIPNKRGDEIKALMRGEQDE